MAAAAARAASPEGKKQAAAAAAIRAELRKIGRGGDVRAIVAGERELTAHEREHRVTSKEQERFLERGLKAMDIALALIDKVQDSERYRGVAESFQTGRNRIDGLPNDEARQAFEVHGKESRAIEEAMAFGLPIDHDPSAAASGVQGTLGPGEAGRGS